MTEPQIIMGGTEGLHNLGDSSERIHNSGLYTDCSTICVVPTRGMIAARVVESFMGLQSPMNQKFLRIFVTGMEVGAAYSAAIEQILAHDELSQWKYVLTMEEDNMPPPDGLIKLIESIDGYGAVGGLYWTKGEGGMPMIYGDPARPINFVPQPPIADTIQECHGLGMGFTLFDLDVFRDERLDKPYFQTVQQFDPHSGGKAYTQDLHFFERIKKLGYKVACDTRVKVGHYDHSTGLVW